MKIETSKSTRFKLFRNLLLAGAAAGPFASHAQTASDNGLTGELNTTGFLLIGGISVASLIVIVLLQRRYRKASVALQDVTGELDVTRQRLSETAKKLDVTQQNLKSSSERYEGILYNADTGMFQMDRSGRCVFINSALQKMSGLYPKKALNEGLDSAIHPDDRESFKEAWNTFVENGKVFDQIFRFQHKKESDTHVLCHVNKVLNGKKEVDSYIGWVTDITRFHQQEMQVKAVTARYARFVSESMEAFYKLEPKFPLPLLPDAQKMAESIMENLVVTECNDTFAAMYGAKPAELLGKSINALKDGCGPFRNNANIRAFVDAGYTSTHQETVRQNPNGNRLNLLNNTVGIIEEDKLIAIWGSQQNISKQKREKEELSSQLDFLNRILDALPADIHVKDTRCRYLYTSRKMAERTGIPQEEWIGKTIFEVMPGTPRDYDQSAIETMKSGKQSCFERQSESAGHTVWMETVQIPLISDDELIEGVIGLSLDTTERRKKEEQALRSLKDVERQLDHTKEELSSSRTEYSKATTSLAEALQNLKVAEAEKVNQQHTFEQKLHEHKQTAESLRQDRESLLTRKEQLEEQLAKGLRELNEETAKRKKWEELLQIREHELKKYEDLNGQLNEQYAREAGLREEAEKQIREIQTALRSKEEEIKTLAADRQQIEKQLKKTEDLRQKTEEQMRSLTAQYTSDMEHEVAEHKIVAEKLIQTTEQLTEFKRDFNQRLDEETKSIKTELAKKQISEKALRQQEKDLQKRVQELEDSLQAKNREYTDQLKAKEKTEVEKEQIKQKLAAMESQQKTLIERETQKLNLNIAEFRLEEVKLRKQVDDLQRTRNTLEETIKTREAELDEAAKLQKETVAELSKAQAELKAMTKDQEVLLAKETRSLQGELKELKKAEAKLLAQEEALQKRGSDLEQTVAELSDKLKLETAERQKAERELKDLRSELQSSQNNREALVKKHTEQLQKQVDEYQKKEVALKAQSEELQHMLDGLNKELSNALEERDQAEHELKEVIKRASMNAQETEAQIAEIRGEHESKIRQIREEQKDLQKNEKHYRAFFQAASDAFLQINPETGKIETANLAAAHLFGEEASAALADKSLDALCPEHQPDETPSGIITGTKLQAARESGYLSFEWVFRRADHSEFPALISLSTIDVEDQQFILAVVNNISGIRSRIMELEQSIEVAQATNRMNSQVVDEVNQAIQTSLSPVIQSSANMEKDENLTEKQKIEVVEITRNCRTLIDMMNYRSELSRIGDGTDAVKTRKCDLHELINDIDQQFNQRAETKKLFFAVSYAQYQSNNNVPKLVEADEQKVRKVFSILLGYALAQTEKGRLGLHASRKSCVDETITVTFELAYTGKNSRDDLLDSVFNADEGAENKVADMQYGLTLAHRYITALGGNIGLQYRQGGVTALIIEFPFKKVASEAHQSEQENEKQAGAA